MSEDSPLDVLLKVMRRQFVAEDYDRAVAAAKLAAPYVHGRAPGLRPTGDLAGVPDEELGEWGGCLGEAAADEGAEIPD